ncbi:MAG: ROK family protein [Leptolyngbya sp. PLA3]|nr:MAG: ROK family protein [Cyanobacteria bacterium CYA]MCE7969901.1 ROK family protein [Leptolyngbya sp. PL-A3]
MRALGLDIGGTSIKAALVDEGSIIGATRSPPYQRPDRAQLDACLSACCDGLPGARDAHCVGLCLPGILAPDRSMVLNAVNIPGIERVPLRELVGSVLGRAAGLGVVNDAHASAFGYWREHRSDDRLLGLALGTGVGACVLDAGKWLSVTGGSSGHIGQIDVGPCGGEPPLGPDGGRNSLEGYLGVEALRARYGDGFAERLGTLAIDEPPMQALVRALRICHAVYRPARVVLLGGVGIRLALRADAIRDAVARELTSVAQPGWTLEVGQSDHHAAAGAGWLALEGM